MSAALLATELGRTMNRLAHARIRSAAAEVAGHRAVDIGVRRFRVLLQQRCRRHDLTGLTVPALGHVHFDPRQLHRVLRLLDSPSIVVMDLPATLSTGVTHERVGTPSTCTVHEPHMALPHPYFVPVIPSVSRSTQRIGVSPATSTSCA